MEAGADAIVAQGLDAGGHGSSVAPLMTLLPDVVDLMRDIAHEGQKDAPVPVLAAGHPLLIRILICVIVTESIGMRRRLCFNRCCVSTYSTSRTECEHC